MAKFINDKNLEDTIYDIIWNAEVSLFIVSPFIKLDDYFKRLFDKHVNNPKLHILIVFGKNEDNVKKSLSKSDFDFFKKFLNISIIYVPSLHGKFYGNETKGIITSINLHDYSFKNNIEFGICLESNFLDKFTTTTYEEVWDACTLIADKNEAVFIKRPVYEKKALSALLGRSYIKSDTLHDSTEKFYSFFGTKNKKSLIKKLKDFPELIELGSEISVRPTREEFETPTLGFCIRTGESIPYNPNRPFCEKAFKSWIQFGNRDFPEKFCHKTGMPSKGRTSMNNPILA